MTWTGIIIFTIIVCVIAGVAEYRAQHELPFNDMTATSEDDTAAYHGQERAVN